MLLHLNHCGDIYCVNFMFAGCWRQIAAHESFASIEAIASNHSFRRYILIDVFFAAMSSHSGTHLQVLDQLFTLRSVSCVLWRDSQDVVLTPVRDPVQLEGYKPPPELIRILPGGKKANSQRIGPNHPDFVSVMLSTLLFVLLIQDMLRWQPSSWNQSSC